MPAQTRLDPTIKVAVETAPRKAFATAVDWPGWSRSGKTEEAALAALSAAAPRYAIVAEAAAEPFAAGDYEIVERSAGGSGTEYGIPSVIAALDRRPVADEAADRIVRVVAAAWTTFDRVAASAPAELRKGPRGGGRDRAKMVGHVVESDWYYAREMGIRVKQPDPADRPAIQALRAAMLEILGQPSDGSPLAGRRWPPRYAANRTAWHALDHAWEIEDRSDPRVPGE
jgi:hypothetical protein